ncbi:uncharacterized protein Dvir_GJ21410 [Drosophila virilis]|uniref:Uncharacterized protein n=2 Tax=Drosophila virilis TaxID=7244 RepID=B4LPZ3_DROVI|nr:uncharacterized protein Dvir_GJ21410 [Drosophila virilis]
MTLFRRSQAQRHAAQINGALSDARLASRMANAKMGPNAPIRLQICDALIDLNNFELSDMELHDNARQFVGAKSSLFNKRLLVVEAIIKDVTGRAMSLFFLKNHKLIQQACDLYKASLIKDTRPMWKILRDQQKCDILSIPEIEEVLLSPLEKARRSRAFNVIHQTYLNDSWVDVVFMKELRKNPNLLLDQCKRSKRLLQILSVEKYDVVRQFIKMMHSRSPFYYVSYVKFLNKKMLEKNKEAYLYRIQYQTHRNMIADLKEIRKLRKEKNVKRLTGYVEKIMGDYYVRKTNRVMCWKFEFTNEVYNTLALALCEQYRVPKNFRYSSTSMYRLLLLPLDKAKEPVPFVFGDRSTYQDGSFIDPAAISSRKLITRLEKRIRFAKYSIEKCYLLHRIACIHLSQGRYDESCLNARKAIKETHNCNSLIWKFLGIMQKVKAYCMQKKVEKTREALEKAIPLCDALKNPPLINFLEVCVSCSVEDTAIKASLLLSQRPSGISTITSN